MSNWVEDTSYIGSFEIDKRFIRQIGFFYYEYKRFVKYPWNEGYTVYHNTVHSDNGKTLIYNNTTEEVNASELLSKYSEFNILSNALLINKVVNNIKQILHDRRTTKEI